MLIRDHKSVSLFAQIIFKEIQNVLPELLPLFKKAYKLLLLYFDPFQLG